MAHQVRIWHEDLWGILSASGPNDTFTIDGDYTAVFVAGCQFEVAGADAGNDGAYTTVSSTLTGGDTVISVAENVETQTAGGGIHVYDYLSSEWILPRPRRSRPGERITDRLGRVHRITPPGDAKQSLVVALLLELEGMDAHQLSSRNWPVDNAGTAPGRLRWNSWLDQYCNVDDAQLTVFSEFSSRDAEKTQYTERRAYRCRAEQLPPEWDEMLVRPHDRKLGYVELELFVDRQGTFTDFDDLSSADFTDDPRSS